MSAGIRWPEAIALLQAMETKTTCASNVVTWSWTWRPVGWYDFSSHPTGSHSSYPVFSAGNSHLRSPTMLPSTLAPKHWNGSMPFTFLTECRGRMIGGAETHLLLGEMFWKILGPGCRSRYNFGCWRFRSGGNIHGYIHFQMALIKWLSG